MTVYEIMELFSHTNQACSWRIVLEDPSSDRLGSVICDSITWLGAIMSNMLHIKKFLQYQVVSIDLEEMVIFCCKGDM